MKTLFKLSVFAAVIILVAIGCQKMLSNEDVLATPFNTTAAKNWYYGTYIKSAEWSGSAQKDKQLPDWKNGVITTIENKEAIVYPFIKGTHSFTIPGNNTLTNAECKRVADGSLSKIAFIKTGSNQFTIREMDYIPDWQYLQKKQFNIGEMKDSNGKPDFTGRIIIKDWAGNVMAIKVQVDGKTVKTGKRVQNKEPDNTTKGENTSSITCTYTQMCLWQQDCVLTIYGDGMIENECGEWYIVECWMEENCTVEEEEEEEEEGPPTCDPALVSPQEEEFNNYIQQQPSSQLTEDAATSTAGPNPVSGTHIWTVASGSSWQVKANTNYSYYHDSYYDLNLNAIIHTYNLFNYQTVSSYYTGSNSYITSTWTQTSVLDQVLDNNTSNTRGKSIVHGTIRNQMGLPLNLPFCPKALDITTPIDPNILILSPR